MTTRAFTTLCFILAGSLSTYILKKHPSIVSTFAFLAPVLGFFSVLLILICQRVSLLLIASMFVGVEEYCFSISGVMIGQVITPKKHLQQ